MSISKVCTFLPSIPHDWASHFPLHQLALSRVQILNQLAIQTFRAASYLTDPICKSHEFYRRIFTVEALHPTSSRVAHLARKASFAIGAAGWASLALFTTLPGVVLRSSALYMQKDPFIYVQGQPGGKDLPSDRSFSLLSWNVCCVGGGYPISDGGVMPWSFRIDNIVRKVIEKDADVNCLYETFDSESAFYICKKLKEKGYNHFYFNIGPKAIGVSSGILVASKYNIKNPEFSPFPQSSLVGRTKSAAKGVFGFDLESRGQHFARIYSTHLQHAEEPAFSTDEEVEARNKQMQIIVEKVNTIRDRCVVVTGDLNLDDSEYETSSWHHRFEKGEWQFGSMKTWEGDEFCARMVGKRVSGPLNLDHTIVARGTNRSLSTSLVETGYDATTFKKEALSDHAGLLSILHCW